MSASATQRLRWQIEGERERIGRLRWWYGQKEIRAVMDTMVCDQCGEETARLENACGACGVPLCRSCVSAHRIALHPVQETSICDGCGLAYDDDAIGQCAECDRWLCPACFEQHEHDSGERMAAMSEQPMSDERLAQMRETFMAMWRRSERGSYGETYARASVEALDELIRTRAKLAAAQEIVRAVADAGVADGDEYGVGSWLLFSGYDAETVRQQARAQLAKGGGE